MPLRHFVLLVFFFCGYVEVCIEILLWNTAKHTQGEAFCKAMTNPIHIMQAFRNADD